MDEEKQFMKYLSWLDDLDQDFIFDDAGNALAVKMDQHDLAGQSTANNALQYDGNMANFDYSTKMMPDYSVNEAMMTEAMSTVQPNVIPNSYDYAFLSNDNYYSNPSLPQHHISMNPGLHGESPYCMNSAGAGHSNNDSYANISEPQLCIDVSADSTNLGVQHESSQYGLSSDVDIKDNFFTEEKHIIDSAYSGEQLSVNNSMNSSFPNEFAQIQNQAELYRNEVVQGSMQTDDITAHQNSYINNAPNLDNNAQNSAITELPITVNDDFKERLKMEHSLEVKEELRKAEVEPQVFQDQRVAPFPAETIHEVSRMEVTKQENAVKEERPESETQSNVNGVDKVSLENEIPSTQMCIRNGCANRAVNNPEWEQEFCSNDCVIIHCRNVFTAWVKANEINSQ